MSELLYDKRKLAIERCSCLWYSHGIKQVIDENADLTQMTICFLSSHVRDLVICSAVILGSSHNTFFG